MDVILHIGAHRTGTTTLQDYLRRHADELNSNGVGYRGPRRKRNDGVARALPPEVVETAAMSDDTGGDPIAPCAAQKTHTLIVSNAGMIGSVPNNLRHQTLYPNAGHRVARFAAVFGDRVSKVVITPRSLEMFWASSIADAVTQSHAVPDPAALRKIAHSTRGWRDVIADVAQALPDVDIHILPFDGIVGRPETFLRLAADINGPLDRDRQWLSRTPNLPDLRRALSQRNEHGQVLPFGMGRWNPFTPEETAALRESYADDMMWLVAGADGLATLREEGIADRAGTTLPWRAQLQGHEDEHQEGSMA